MDHSLKRVLGFKPKYPKVEIGEIKVIVRDFKEDRLWQVFFFSSWFCPSVFSIWELIMVTLGLNCLNGYMIKYKGTTFTNN